MYYCSVCQYQEDRDVNAAINLKHLAEGHAENLNACRVHIRHRKVQEKDALNTEAEKAIWKQL